MHDNKRSIAKGVGKETPCCLLFGGPGGEHRVSIASAQNIALGFGDHCMPRYWCEDGRILAYPLKDLLTHADPFEQPLPTKGLQDGWPSLEAWLDALAAQKDASKADGDIAPVWIALHGGAGEDGTVQKAFARAGLRHTGSGFEASRTAFFKHQARACMQAQNVRMAAGKTLSAADLDEAQAWLMCLLQEHGGAIVKPVDDGSSLGVVRLREPKEIPAVLDAVHAQPRRLFLAEAWIVGVEVTCSVIATPEDGLKTLPLTEVRLDEGRMFDFAGKYHGKGSLEVTPAEIPHPMAEAMASMALVAHQSLGCLGYSRTDAIIDAKGPVYLETNTLPGLTAASFLPQQLAVAQIPWLQFLKQQLQLAQ